MAGRGSNRALFLVECYRSSREAEQPEIMAAG